MQKLNLPKDQEAELHEFFISHGIPEHAIVKAGGANGLFTNLFSGLSTFVATHPMVKSLIQAEIQKLLVGLLTGAVAGS